MSASPERAGRRVPDAVIDDLRSICPDRVSTSESVAIHIQASLCRSRVSRSCLTGLRT